MFYLYTYTSISCLSNIYTKSEWKKTNKIQQCCYGYDKVFTTELCNQQSTSVFGCTIFKLIWVMLLVLKRHFQQHFYYIVAVIFIGGENWRKPLNCACLKSHKMVMIALLNRQQSNCQLTEVIGTDCQGRCNHCHDNRLRVLHLWCNLIGFF